jgi:hypothetical protein
MTKLPGLKSSDDMTYNWRGTQSKKCTDKYMTTVSLESLDFARTNVAIQRFP